ncbi:MAG: hypothetical protein RI918_1574 [Pseudomonadota bacterium]|jgi:hypothetical protein
MCNAEYASYQALCKELVVTPCEYEQWEITIHLIEEHHLPYISSRSTLWVHDKRRKTLRADKPFGLHLKQPSPRAAA